MRIIKHIYKLFGRLVWIPIVKRYLQSDRRVQIDGIQLVVPVGVFHPGLFLSTKFLLEYVKSCNLVQKQVLELGAGTGFLSVAMAKQQAIVTASDINKTACQTVTKNAAMNNGKVIVIHSNLFDDFDKNQFDLMLINPPYYPKNAQTDADQAWFCGENFEYFQKLFLQMPLYLKPEGKAVRACWGIEKVW